MVSRTKLARFKYWARTGQSALNSATFLGRGRAGAGDWGGPNQGLPAESGGAAPGSLPCGTASARFLHLLVFTAKVERGPRLRRQLGVLLKVMGPAPPVLVGV